VNKKNILIIIGIFVVIIGILFSMFAGSKEEEKIVYYAIFNDNNGNNFYIVEYEKGEIVKEPEKPKRDGYIFLKWKNNGKDMEFNNVKIEQNMTFIASWEKEADPTFTVSFNSNGGSSVNSQTITEGNKATKPANPTYKGYIFKGWYLNGEEYDFNSEVKESIVLEAKWEKEVIVEQPKVVKYTVTFNSNGGSGVKSQSVEEGKKATKPVNPTKNGYVFKEWTLNGKAYNFNTAVNKNITLVATWEKKVLSTFTVTFNSNGGSSVAKQSVLEGNKVKKPANPTRSGYTFKGWYLNGKAYNFNTAVSKNITLTAQWTAISYTIKVSSVDSYSPDRTLKVYENNKAISVKSIHYTDGTYLCSGSNMTVSASDLSGVSKLQVVLNNGTKVTATIK